MASDAKCDVETNGVDDNEESDVGKESLCSHSCIMSGKLLEWTRLQKVSSRF